ncbi:probable polygalacturonase At3g15720 [Malania oleifera]|uniref:probable polygalacturonase At3g15720 n=1 Tax=Malania oleifera TaxID=397392 RepID=UPI0025AE07A4|nr:probable polygalacturonase At3g15720 [Malania oleifera]
MTCFSVNRSPKVSLDGRVVGEDWIGYAVDFFGLREGPAMHVSSGVGSRLDEEKRVPESSSSINEPVLQVELGTQDTSAGSSSSGDLHYHRRKLDRKEIVLERFNMVNVKLVTGTPLDVLAIALLLCITLFNVSSGLVYSNVFDVMEHGAIGDGQSDDSQAFAKAWETLCSGSGGSNALIVPSGKTFRLQPTRFAGPCRAERVHVQILGSLVAPAAPGDWDGCVDGSWLSFSGVEGLTIDGSGTIDGQGSLWWQNPNAALHFNACNNLLLKGLTHMNSPRNHISITNCKGVMVSNLKIVAPEKSPNTDGIDISQSDEVTIQHSSIGTGDDCIAINTGSTNVNITNIACGPGHGISIGSLGHDGQEDTVVGVYVGNSIFTGTQNGARIKTWPGGSGYARQITFEHITLDKAQNPIIIDQNYCNGLHNCRASHDAKQSDVEVSDVTFNDFHGSCAGEEAISFKCSPSVPCSGIKVSNVRISSIDGQKPNVICSNAKGTCTSSIPEVSCLSS